MNTTYNPKSWMQDNLKEFGQLTIGQLSIPGAHDAGMSCKNSGTAFAFDCNVVTQYHPILEQLKLGVRFFDLRPVISDGAYYTGHYTNTGVPVIGWQGGNGQSIRSIVSDINTFTQAQNELVILRISHDLDTDTGRDYLHFTQEQYNGLYSELAKLTGLYPGKCDNFLDVTLNDCIVNSGDNKPCPCVIIIVDPENKEITANNEKGIFPDSALKMYNEYSDTNVLETMVQDQLQKMQGGHGYFMLNWILTQNSVQASICNLGVEKSILQLAQGANAVLSEYLLPVAPSLGYPNIILLDGIDSSLATELAIMYNKIVAQQYQ